MLWAVLWGGAVGRCFGAVLWVVLWGGAVDVLWGGAVGRWGGAVRRCRGAVRWGGAVRTEEEAARVVHEVLQASEENVGRLATLVRLRPATQRRLQPRAMEAATLCCCLML